MTTVFVRRVLSLAIAGVCIVVVGAFLAGTIRSGLNPKEASLALRIDASRTRVFFATKDRALFDTLFTRFVPDAVPGTMPLDMQTLPVGQRYECAVVKTGSGSVWVIYVRQPEQGRHQTIVSASDPTVFLPLNKTTLSLQKSGVIREYVGSSDESWLFMEPSVLTEDGHGIIRSVMKSLFPPMSRLLVVWRSDHHGIVVVSGPHPNIFTPVAMTAPLSPVPLVRLDAGNPSDDLRMLGELMSANDRNAAEGLGGILRNTLKSLTERTDIETFAETMLAGPASVVVTRSGNGLAFGLMSTARNPDDLAEWMTSVSAADAGAHVREIVFPKHENIRRDVSAEIRSGFQPSGESGGWQRSLLGSGSVLELHLATQGRRYALATTAALLEGMIKVPSETPQGKQTDGAISGTVDAGWLMAQAGEILGAEGTGVQKDLEGILGPHAVRAVWSARPVDRGWLLDWTVTNSLPSPAPRSLAK